MAKVSFNKLNLKKDDSVTIVKWGDEENPIEIEVKNYLPIEEKLQLITDIIVNSVDENGYYNPGKIYIYTILHTIMTYTNINFTDKQKEDPAKLYDLIVSSGLSSKIFNEGINPYEYQQIKNWINESIVSIYEYKNSAYAILDSMKEDYNNLDMNATNIYEKLDNPDNLKLIKQILDKMD